MRVSEAELRVIRLLQQQITEGCERGELFARDGMTVATAEGLLYRFFKRNGICNRQHFYRSLATLDFSQLATIQRQRATLNPRRGVRQRGNRWIAYASHTRESSGYLGSFYTEEEALAARQAHDKEYAKAKGGGHG